jgi:7-cyano-7-deazaguanine synthase in queuosine biosynthesis
MTTQIALTGGLDSTWCLVNGKKAHNDFEALLFNMGNGVHAVLVEYLMSREIIRRLWKEDKGGSFKYETLGQLALGGYIATNNNTPTMRMVQQGRVVNGLARAATEHSRVRDPIHCVVGWHRDDAFENNSEYGDWSLEDYAKLKQLFELQCYFADTGRRIQPLQTPAWDKSKLEMWQELPLEIRPLITIHWHSALNFYYSAKRNELLIYTSPKHFSTKANKYMSLGIDVPAAWIIEVDENLLCELRTTAIEKAYLPMAIKHLLDHTYPNASNSKNVLIDKNITINHWYTHARWSTDGEAIIVEFKEDFEEAYGAALSGKKEVATEVTG